MGCFLYILHVDFLAAQYLLAAACGTQSVVCQMLS